MDSEKPVVPAGDNGFLRIRMDLSYDGAPFSGWAVQPGRRTVQGCLEEALAMLLRRPVRVVVAGRTDAGVHARGQVVHFDVAPGEWGSMDRGRAVDPSTAFLRRLRGTLSRVLGDLTGAIEPHAAVPAPPGFDARFSALWRRYSYRIADSPARWDPVTRHFTLWHRQRQDIGLLNEAAVLLLGMNDFLSFCKPREGSTTIRELQRFEFERADDGVLRALVQADAFCHNMVRALIGSALQVGSGEREPAWLYQRMLARAKDSRSLLAPPHPLVLEEVCYPDDDGVALRADLTRARREG